MPGSTRWIQVSPGGRCIGLPSAPYSVSDGVLSLLNTIAAHAASNMQTAASDGRQIGLDIESEMHDIAVLHHVVLSFQSQLATVPCARLATEGECQEPSLDRLARRLRTCPVFGRALAAGRFRERHHDFAAVHYSGRAGSASTSEHA